MTAGPSTSGAIISGTDDDDVVTATQSPAGQPLPTALDALEASDLILDGNDDDTRRAGNGDCTV